MAKKNFKGIDAFFGGTAKESNKSEIETIHLEKSTEQESKENVDKTERRATFILESDILEKLKAVAYWERKTSKLILNQCLEEFFEKKGSSYISEALKAYKTSKDAEKD